MLIVPPESIPAGRFVLDMVFRRYQTVDQLAEGISDELSEQIHIAVTTNGACHMVYPGGTSPRPVLKALRKRKLPWERLHLYPSDERCVPAGDAERNDRLIEELLLHTVPLRQEHIHRIPAELGPEQGALQFASLLQQVPRFDIVVVGIGQDGHIASLFPGHPAISDDREAVPVCDAPKPPPSRVSIGLGRLQKALHRHIIAFGREKVDFIASHQRLLDTPAMSLKAKIWYALE